MREAACGPAVEIETAITTTGKEIAAPPLRLSCLSTGSHRLALHHSDRVLLLRRRRPLWSEATAGNEIRMQKGVIRSSSTTQLVREADRRPVSGQQDHPLLVHDSADSGLHIRPLSPDHSRSPSARLPFDRFSEWVHCLCVVTFDIEVGQAIEKIYPSHVKLTDREVSNPRTPSLCHPLQWPVLQLPPSFTIPAHLIVFVLPFHQKTNICYLSFPDSNSGCESMHNVIPLLSGYNALFVRYFRSPME